MASTRNIVGVCDLAEGTEMELVLCDGYGRDLGRPRTTVTVGSAGAFAVTLEVNEHETCWVNVTSEPSVAFWVYEPTEGADQTVDLVRGEVKRNSLPNLLHADGRTAAANAERVYGDVACGEDVIGEEEQRFLCRFEDGMGSEEDVPMCTLNNDLIKRFENG